MSSEAENAVAAAITHAKTRLVPERMLEWSARIERFMNAKPDPRGLATVSDLVIPKESGGSSGTILFAASYAESGETEKLVLRYHTDSSHANYSDMAGQYGLLKALQKTDVPSPRVTEFDATGEYFGVPGFVMKRIEGESLPPTYYLNGPLFDAAPEVRGQMIRDAIGGLVTLHRVDWRALGLEKFTRKGEGKTHLESDLNWYWKALMWGMPEFAPRLAPVRQWLLGNQFEPKRLVICHGDSSLHNYMYDGSRFVGMLDWEFAFISPPEADLAFQTSANEILGLGNPPLSGLPDNEERKAIYEELSSNKLDHWDYYSMIGFYKLYIHMALSFRGASSSLDAARDNYLDYAFGRINDCWEKARSAA